MSSMDTPNSSDDYAAAQDRELALRHIECADWILARASDLEMQAKEWRNLAGKLLHPPPDTKVSVAWSNGVPTLRFVTTEEVRDAG